ncbi:hypothetical protein BU23DRAFT_152312 [Bimuria novae-zelandiae CBS 107.79]|uniref:Heterokaryon incompatibility domain-containing protein n=1 Tax=Bimuria novae-zelandiae CBS 107.79 TaxID=1447943 RepID=A0A6A5W1Q0_9PLEO|nr:hypothetical protein BU23DRAFT_152312 [Bimuria novae-zelandiae CBS 107.79]
MIPSNFGNDFLLWSNSTNKLKVLQEIAAARVMVVLYGDEEITGACFYQGLPGLLRVFNDPHVRSVISPMIYLLGDASVLRVKKYTVGEPFRLKMCSLSQLVNIFRLREATDWRDKVYALLGMTSQRADEPEIVPDYGMEWPVLFRNLVQSILGPQVQASWISNAGQEYGQVVGKGCTVGYVSKMDNSKSNR